MTAKKKSRHARKAGHCSLRVRPERILGPQVSDARARAILRMDKKWLNGTTLRYYFFNKSTDGEKVQREDGSWKWMTWTTSKAQKDSVRRAFKIWADIGIGVEFEEVHAREDAQVRIGFMRGDGAWSWVGRDVLLEPISQRTMNLGWSVTTPYGFDTAIHEIGHTLGLPHEHQNPNSGIVWNAKAVYASFSAPPDEWSRAEIRSNILRKIPASLVRGGDWDPNSIMHYEFEAGLIKKPTKYKDGLYPEPGLSKADKSWIQKFYPPAQERFAELKPGQSILLGLEPGGQRNFMFEPTETRSYEMKVFGQADAVMVLFEDEEGKLRYRSGEDDSGEDHNASIRFQLIRGRRYMLRVRMYYSERPESLSVMLW